MRKRFPSDWWGLLDSGISRCISAWDFFELLFGCLFVFLPKENYAGFLYFFFFFFFGCVGSSLLRVGLRCGAWASHCSGLSRCRAQALGAQASAVVARGLSSCGSRSQLLRGTWNPPRPRLEPVPPALAGAFLTTAPPGKSLHDFYNIASLFYY